MASILVLFVLAVSALTYMALRNIVMLHRRIRSLDEQLDYIGSALAEAAASRDPDQ